MCVRYGFAKNYCTTTRVASSSTPLMKDSADEKKSVLGTKFPGKDGNKKFMDMVAYLQDPGF